MSDGRHLVEHVKRNKNGLTKMQIQVPISTRAGMAELSKRLGISQLAIVRSALAAFLLANEPTWQGTAPAPEPEVITEEATVPTPVAKKPRAAEAAPATKKPRAKKEKAI